MKSFSLIVILLYFVCTCNSQDSVLVKYNHQARAIIKKIKSTELTLKFKFFYEDMYGLFFIKSAGHRLNNGKMELVDVFIEIPKLDSGSFINYGVYFRDSSKVICVFENSDGGNYKTMQNVDPKSFTVFKNTFGGKDKNNVYYQNVVLKDLDPGLVKVYSNTLSCSNCKSYFTDGKVYYFGTQRITKRDFLMNAKEYRYIE